MSHVFDIRSLFVAQAAELLGLTVEAVREHIARGLPLRKDGRVDLVMYAAWLNLGQRNRQHCGQTRPEIN